MLQSQRAIEQAIVQASPALHQKAIAFLESQGFQIEVDRQRTSELPQTSAQDYIWVAPGTAPSPFGGGRSISNMGSSQSQGPLGVSQGPAEPDVSGFPLFGSGSKSNLAKKLTSDRPREAFASVHSIFYKLRKRIGCKLVLRVLDNEANVAFEGLAVGTSGGDFSEAFDAALAQMRQPVIR